MVGASEGARHDGAGALAKARTTRAGIAMARTGSDLKQALMVLYWMGSVLVQPGVLLDLDEAGVMASHLIALPPTTRRGGGSRYHNEEARQEAERRAEGGGTGLKEQPQDAAPAARS